MNNFEMNEDNGEGQFQVNIENILDDDGVISAVKVAAMNYQRKGYLSVGEFLKTLPDTDLRTLLDIVEEQQELDEFDEIHEPYQNIVLLAILLAEAESVDIVEEEQLSECIRILGALLTMEGLKRKGYVELVYDKISFGEDFKSEIICKKTAKFDKWIEEEGDNEDE